MNKLFFSALLTLFCFNLQGQNLNLKKLDKFLDSLSTQNKVMGSIAIYQDGKKVFTKSVGYNDILIRSTGNSETLFRIGEVSESFIAPIVLELIEQGKLKLSTPLSEFYSELPKASQISIRDLLAHRSGLPDFKNDSLVSYKKVNLETSALFRSYHKKSLRFKPGEKRRYSNMDYFLLSKIVEQILHKPIQKVVRDLTKDLSDSRIKLGDKINSKNNEALSYEFKSKQWTDVQSNDWEIPFYKGQISTTPKTLAQLYHRLFSYELIDSTSLQKMLKMRAGLKKTVFHDKRVYGYSGTIDGFDTSVAYIIDDNTSIALCLNATKPESEVVLTALLNLYFGY